MSKILDLKQYDLVFTTSFGHPHGVSGHFYELIDYYFICSAAGINCSILLSDGITKDVFRKAISNKYDFTDLELEKIINDTVECFQPRIIMANNVCIVDGSWRMKGCTVYADNVFLFRCSEPDFTYFDKSKSIKHTHLMQDFKLYPERFEDLNITVIDYIKKILWGRYKRPNPVKTDTAMLYLTTNCRGLTLDVVKNIIDKNICSKYLIITNEPGLYSPLSSNTVSVEKAPIQNVFERFDTYIYTPTDLQQDCSPRFIVECALFNKDVVYEIDYVCAGLERRKEDIKNNFQSLELTADDFFIKYFKDITNGKTN